MAKGCESSTSPSIKVISPNSGAYWYQENAVSVSWLTSNIPRTDDQEVLIRLRSVQTGEEYNLGIATNNKPGSTATAAMAIPSTIPIGSYYVEVKTSVNGTSYMDASDEYIKIMANNVTALNADAAIKSTLMTSRAQAEIYWSNKMDSSSSYTGSYLGVCTASSQKLGLLELRNTIKEAGSETTCNDSSEAWAMSAPLMSNTSQNFCVDSTGQATVTYSQLGLSTSCIL